MGFLVDCGLGQKVT